MNKFIAMLLVVGTGFLSFCDKITADEEYSRYWIDVYFYPGALSIFSSIDEQSFSRISLGAGSEGEFISIGDANYESLALAHGEDGKEEISAAKMMPWRCAVGVLGFQILCMDNPAVPRDVSSLYSVDERAFRCLSAAVESGYKASVNELYYGNDRRIRISDLTAKDYFWFDGYTKVYIDEGVRKQEGIKRIRVVVKRAWKRDLTEDYEYED